MKNMGLCLCMGRGWKSIKLHYKSIQLMCCRGNPPQYEPLLFFFFWSPLVRRHLFDHLLWSIFQSSLHILHITNHTGPSVWAVIHVLHSRHFHSFWGYGYSSWCNSCLSVVLKSHIFIYLFIFLNKTWTSSSKFGKRSRLDCYFL